MSLLQLADIQKWYGTHTVLSGVSLTVNEGDRIGLIGANGSGKSTLMRIIMGEEIADRGELTFRRGTTVSFLPQLVEGTALTAVQTVTRSRDDIAELEAQLELVGARIADEAVYSDMRKLEHALARQAALIEEHEALGGPTLERRARESLIELGLPESSHDVPTTELSGGQRKMVALAAAAMREPDVLLLDEPETHLDHRRRTLVEQWIRNFSGAVIVVSHDRYLLDETVSQIAALGDGVIEMWPGNYSAYAVALELRLQRQQEQFVAQQKEIARLEEAVKRFKDWASRVVDERHIKQARNKQRQIDSMDKIDKPVFERRKIGLTLRAAKRGGDQVVRLEHVDAGFGGDPVLRDVNIDLIRGERIGVIGANGAGKTVLTRLITGDHPLITGKRWIGPSISVGYLQQGHDSLDPDRTPVEIVRSAFPISEGEAVSRLAKFLFSYDQTRKRVADFSGGEKMRLQLLLIMLARPNFLVLDEPTNHLDVDSIEMLEGALERFDGTILFVSHDRYFLNRIADRLLIVDGGRVASFEMGSYDDWLERRKVAAAT